MGSRCCSGGRDRRNGARTPSTCRSGAAAVGDGDAAELRQALDGSELIIVAVPSHGLRHVMEAARPFLPSGATIVSTTKGLEEGTLLRMSELLARGRRRRVPGGRALGSELRVGSRPRACPRRSWLPPLTPRTVALVQDEFRGRFLRAVRQRGCRRRRDRRRAEERDRHCRRRGRGHGPGAQRAGRAHHPRPGRDHAPGLARLAARARRWRAWPGSAISC